MGYDNKAMTIGIGENLSVGLIAEPNIAYPAKLDSRFSTLHANNDVFIAVVICQEFWLGHAVSEP
jgi:hypothetical protein